MANPFEMIKKGMSAMNPIGGNATPPKDGKKPDMGKIRAKGKKLAEGSPEEEAAETPEEESKEQAKGKGDRPFPFKKGK